MDFRCPTCNKDLTVPDEYAGQLMKCPLCSNVFQAPALPPPPATYGLAPPPTPPPPPPPASAPSAPARTEPPKPTKTKEPPSPPPPPSPPGDYTHRRSIFISSRVVPFIAPVAHFLVFVLTFFPWVILYPKAPEDAPETWMAWGAAFSGYNPLLIPFILLALLALPLLAILTGLRLMSHVVKIPPGLQQIWPWRSAVAAFIVFLALFFLALQVLTGFNANNLPGFLVQRTVSASLALGLEFIAFVALLIEFWLELRGPSRPTPRIELSW